MPTNKFDPLSTRTLIEYVQNEGQTDWKKLSGKTLMRRKSDWHDAIGLLNRRLAELDMTDPKNFPLGSLVSFESWNQGRIYQEGKVVKTDSQFVWVLYDGDFEPKATYAKDLKLRFLKIKY